MSCRESVLGFTCEGQPLVGILAEPEALAAAEVGVLIVVGGPQYRAGSHRQFTLLARHLASNGFPTLRFDYRGMGDSGGEARTFESVDADIASAISGLMEAQPHLKGVVLHGLCDAASATLIYCDSRQDRRVLGLALQNPWFRSEEGAAQAVMTHYYGKRLRSPAFWKKLLSGGIGISALRDFFGNRRKARAAPFASQSFRARMLSAWTRTNLPVMLQLSHQDLTAREFVLGFDSGLANWSGRPRLTRREHPSADHTFSSAAAERKVQAELVQWLRHEVLA